MSDLDDESKQRYVGPLLKCSKQCSVVSLISVIKENTHKRKTVENTNYNKQM